MGLWRTRKISDQDRLWLERGKEKRPVCCSYPTEGEKVVTWYKDGDAEFKMKADFSRRVRVYLIYLDGVCVLETTDRNMADMEYERVRGIVRGRLIEQER